MIILRLTIIVGVIVFIYLSLGTHWSDSELWALGLARDFLSSNQPSTDYKVLFNAFLKATYLFDVGNLETIQIARLMFAGIGLGSAGISVLLDNAARWGKSRRLMGQLFIYQFSVVSFPGVSDQIGRASMFFTVNKPLSLPLDSKKFSSQTRRCSQYIAESFDTACDS